FAPIINNIHVESKSRRTQDVARHTANEDEFNAAVDEQRKQFVKLRAHRLRARRARCPARRNSAANELKRTSFSSRWPGVSFRFSRNSVRSTPGMKASTTGSR